MRWLLGLLLPIVLASPAMAQNIMDPSGSGSGAGISNGTSFPVGPSTNDLFLIIDDSTTGACDSGAGTAMTLCIYDGANWVPLNVIAEADTIQTVFARGAEITGADSSANALKVGNGTRKWYLYDDATDGLQLVCYITSLNNCDYYRKLNAGKKAGWKDSSGNIDFEYDEATGKVSVITSDAEDTSVTLTRPFYWDLDLCAISPSDSSLSHVWNKDPLSTAPTLTAKAGTNRSICVLTFPDSDGDYGVQIRRQLPTGWVGSFDADIWWDTTGTGNARFQIATKCYADDEADDAANNTASVVTAAAGTSGRPNKQTVTGITVTGCAADELMGIRFFRNRTEASDTLNAALNVEKVRFKGRTTK